MNRASSATGWVRNPDGTLGWTWNPITGCLNGCEYCYARKLAYGWLKPLYLANRNVAPLAGDWWLHKFPDGEIDSRYDSPFYPRFWEERLSELDARNRFIHDIKQAPKQRGIFVCDMGDLFGIGIPEMWTTAVLNTIDLNDGYDRFYLLTKHPEYAVKFSPFPENCWVGVTVTRDIYCTAALYHLQGVEATVKFLSLEPLLMEIPTIELTSLLQKVGISWLIIGAQTKPYKPPEIEWVREIVEAADKAGIPVFLKDNLKPLYIAHTKAQGQICSDYILRQEMP